MNGIVVLKRHMAPDLLQKAAADVMTAGPKTIAAVALGVEAVNVKLHNMEIIVITPIVRL